MAKDSRRAKAGDFQVLARRGVRDILGARLGSQVLARGLFRCVQSTHVKQSLNPGDATGFGHELGQLDMRNVKFLGPRLALVQDSDEIDNDILPREFMSQKSVVENISVDYAHGGEHQEIAMAFAMARDDRNLVAGFV